MNKRDHVDKSMAWDAVAQKNAEIERLRVRCEALEAENERLRGVAQSAPAWQPIETAPKEQWIIGYTSWGQQVGKFHEWVGPCEWIGDHFEFANADFDVFPLPTHWVSWPNPIGPELASAERKEPKP